MLKKSLAPSFWNLHFSPTTTPELSPTSSDSDSDEEMDAGSGSRPASLAVPVGACCPMRPTLNEVLANNAAPPYTLSAFMAYLSQNHCLETLEFTMDAQRYRESYETLRERAGDAVTTDSPESQHLRMLWQRLLTAYILPGAPREINLSSEDRDGLLRYRDVTIPPVPETLDSAVKRIHDLMEESIFLPFLNSHTISPSILPTDLSLSPEDLMSLSPPDENLMKKVRSRAKRISPMSSTKDLSTSTRGTLSLSPVHVHAKLFSAALSSSTSNSTSVESAPALTDSSSLHGSPEEPITPPTTPPASEPNFPISSPKMRTENPWKKMGMRLGFKKRSGHGSVSNPKNLGLDE
ncbi:hypothetical protein N7495_006035 [Penicillium taxi]|uniref:uncharacterized protein n=1 Tax=Penicillium taxi TaxID=168475 RepID=UPI002545B3BC|nr:uncharacterized protein N7495_006035 [Penicillium taxi]KAJ5894344.1 hypothetical protein N7495_006035 [Penicillium taxi]